MKLLASVIFALVVASSTATTKTEESKILFNYEDGVEYNYEYFLALNTNEKDINRSSQVNYTVGFTLQFFNDDGVLKINTVEIADNTQEVDIDSKKNYFTDYYLRFKVKPDGNLTWFLPDKREKEWTLNFKRGLLSLFHLDVNDNKVATDVHGTCFTDYTINKEEEKNTWEIYREKNIVNCNGSIHHDKLFYFFIDSSFRFGGERTQQCNMTIINDIYQNVVCNETLFSSPPTNRATNIIFQNVTYVSKSGKIETSFDEFLTKIAFESSGIYYTNLTYQAEDLSKPLNEKDLFNDAKSYLNEICEKGVKDTLKTNHKALLNFIIALKTLTVEQVKELGKLSTSCEDARENFIDILPYVKTTSSRKVMLEIISEKWLPKYNVEEWLTMLTYSENVDFDTLKYIQKLLTKSQEHNVILTAGSLIQIYCELHKENCKEDVKQLKTQFEKAIFHNYNERKLASASSSASEDLDELLYIYLKGFSNTKLDHKDMSATLIKIINDKTLPDFVRKEAIDIITAMHGNALEEEIKQLENILKKPDEAIAVRIAVFLKFVQLKHYPLVDLAYGILLNEKDSQVSHFIFSFIFKEFRRFIDDEDVSAVKFYDALYEINDKEGILKPNETEFENFSHIYHRGMFNYSVVFTPKSFLPSNARFSERDIFFDINTQDFEEYFLSIFQLEGNSLDKMFAKESGENNAKRVLRSLRKENDKNPFVSLDVYFLGKYLKHFSFKGKQEMKNLLKNFNSIDEIKNYLDKGVNYRKSGLFIRTEVVWITAAGFPVRHDALADYSFEIKMSGKFDAENFDKTRELHFDGLFTPWISANVILSNCIDTYYTKSSKKSIVGASAKIPITTKIDVYGFNEINVDFALVRDDVRLHLRTEHVVGSEKLTISPPKYDEKCNNNIKLFFDLSLCQPYTSFEDIITDVNKYGYADIPARFKHDDTKKNYEFKLKWTKQQEKTYQVVVSHNLDQREIMRNDTFLITVDNDKKIEFKIVFNGVESFRIVGEYDNVSANKYIRFKFSENGNTISNNELYHGFLHYLTFRHIYRYSGVLWHA